MHDAQDTLRLFVALELGEALRAELDKLERALRVIPDMRAVRWVEPKNIHLTLKFLGNTEKRRVNGVTAALERAAHGIAAHELAAEGLGAFPNLNRPNNIWVGLTGDLQTTALLARRIQDECAQEGFPRDARSFNPHLTLGRLKKEVTNAERAAVGKAIRAVHAARYGTIHADAVYLMESDLRPAGPVYKTLEKIPLTA